VRDELRDPRRSGARRLASLVSSGADAVDGASPPPHRTRHLSRFLVKTGTKTVVVGAGDVSHIEADGNYVRLHVEGRSYLLRETMNRLERSLDPAAFVRVHRSAIVSVARVREVEPHLGHDYIVRLANGARVRMSRWYHEEFERRMRHGTG
jgi:two-component system, LytTR family, response regulator